MGQWSLYNYLHAHMDGDINVSYGFELDPNMERDTLRFVTTSWGFSFIQRTYEGLFTLGKFSLCTSMEHAHPSYGHVVLRISLIHWVKLEPNFYAQILVPPCPHPLTLPRALSNVQKPLMSRGPFELVW
jgi:hypothetical protein